MEQIKIAQDIKKQNQIHIGIEAQSMKMIQQVEMYD